MGNATKNVKLNYCTITLISSYYEEVKYDSSTVYISLCKKVHSL